MRVQVTWPDGTFRVYEGVYTVRVRQPDSAGDLGQISLLRSIDDKLVTYAQCYGITSYEELD